MITSNTIKQLQSFHNSDYQIVSIYLGADTRQSPSREFLLTQFHSLLHHSMDKELRTKFAADITRVTEFLRLYVPKARSLVFFTAGEQLWQIIELEFALPVGVQVGESPNIAPILQALPRYAPYLVILVDREKARMFTVEQGELIDHSDFAGGYVPHHAASTGQEPIGGDDTIFRHNEELLKRHIAVVAQEVVAFTKIHDVHFVIIGGHSEIFKKIAASLPPSLRSKIMGNFVTEVAIPLNKILLESKKIAANINHT